jgi:hypothetical protein
MKETKYTVTVTNEDGEVIHMTEVLIMVPSADWEEWEERLETEDVGDYILLPKMDWKDMLGGLGADLAGSMVADYNQKAEKEGDNG